jgi:hypothetical protein
MSELKNKDTQTSLLEDLRSGMIFSGRLSSAQSDTIVRMPFVVFDGVKSTEIDYNLVLDRDTEGESYVNVRVTFKPKAPSPKASLVKILVRAIKELTFTDLKVKVYKNKSELPLEGSDE